MTEIDPANPAYIDPKLVKTPRGTPYRVEGTVLHKVGPRPSTPEKPAMPDKPIEDRTVPIGIKTGIAVIAAIVGGTAAISVQLYAMRRSIEALEANAYTLDKASEVALRQAIENPYMRVVDPRDPSKVITVRSVDHSDNKQGGRP